MALPPRNPSDSGNGTSRSNRQRITACRSQIRRPVFSPTAKPGVPLMPRVCASAIFLPRRALMSGACISQGAGFELAIGALSSSRMRDRSPLLPSAIAKRFTTERMHHERSVQNDQQRRGRYPSSQGLRSTCRQGTGSRRRFRALRVSSPARVNR